MIRLNEGVQKAHPGRDCHHQDIHLEKNAAISNRVIHLLDGWINNGKEMAIPGKNPEAAKRKNNHQEKT